MLHNIEKIILLKVITFNDTNSLFIYFLNFILFFAGGNTIG